MIAFFTSPLFYFFLTVAVYLLFAFLSKRFKTALLNPLLWTIVTLVGYILLMVLWEHQQINPEFISTAVAQYKQSVSILEILLAPVTVALAIPLYMNRHVLKENWLPILVATIVGVGTSIGSVVLFGKILGLDQEVTYALYPRGVTTAIATGISQLLGVSAEVVSITVAVVVITGIVGAVVGPLLIRLFRDDNDIVVGLALGSASHAIGTSKAFDYSSKAGAIASVSMVTNGLLTVVVALVISLIMKATA